jgi:hypothetical protein
LDQQWNQTRRSIIHAFNNVARTSALKDEEIGQQKLVMLLDGMLNEAGPDGTLHLGPIVQYLKDLAVNEDAIYEGILVFHDPANSAGYRSELPPELERLPQHRKNQLLSRYEKRQAGHKRPQAAPASKGGEGSELAQRVANAQPPEQKRKRALAVAFVLTIALGVGLQVYRTQTAPPAASKVVIDDPLALSCDELLGNQGLLICRMSKSAYNALSQTERKSRGEATMAAGATLGYQKLLVMTDGGDLRATFVP